MDVGDNPGVLGAKVLSMDSGSYDWSTLGSQKSLLIGASEKLELKGELMMTSADGSDTRLVLMSGNILETEQGTSLTTALSDLVLAARSDILLNDVALESTREVAIRSLRNIELAQVKVRAESMVRMKASRDLNINGLELSQKLLKHFCAQGKGQAMKNGDLEATLHGHFSGLANAHSIEARQVTPKIAHTETADDPVTL